MFLAVIHSRLLTSASYVWTQYAQEQLKIWTILKTFVNFPSFFSGHPFSQILARALRLIHRYYVYKYLSGDTGLDFGVNYSFRLSISHSFPDLVCSFIKLNFRSSFFTVYQHNFILFQEYKLKLIKKGRKKRNTNLLA